MGSRTDAVVADQPYQTLELKNQIRNEYREGTIDRRSVVRR